MKLLHPAHVFLSIVLVTYSSAQSSDWTEFRGPAGQGHSDAIGLPTT